MRRVQSLASYIEDRNHDPVDPIDLVSEGVFRTIGEAASFAGLGKNTLVNAIGRGEIPVVRAGRTCRIPRKALKLFLAGRLAFRRDLRIVSERAS
jgi:excisionase family DNA binding protein